MPPIALVLPSPYRLSLNHPLILHGGAYFVVPPYVKMILGARSHDHYYAQASDLGFHALITRLTEIVQLAIPVISFFTTGTPSDLRRCNRLHSPHEDHQLTNIVILPSTAPKSTLRMDLESYTHPRPILTYLRGILSTSKTLVPLATNVILGLSTLVPYSWSPSHKTLRSV